MSVDLAFTPQQEALRAQVRELAQRHCPRERARALDRDGTFPADLDAALVAAGLHALAVPLAQGGGGRGMLELAIVCEELARAVPALALAWAGAGVAGGWALAPRETGAPHRPLLEAFVAGRARVALAAETEARVTAATAPGGARVIAGTLPLPAGTGASHVLALAQPDPAAGGGPALLVVATDAPGVTVTPIAAGAARAVPSCEVTLAGAPVDALAVLAEGEAAATAFAGLLERHRLLLAAASLGLADVALEDAIAAAQRPHGDGRPTATTQVTQHALAAVHTRVEAARLLVRHAAWRADAGEALSPHGALARHYAADAATQAAAAGMRVLGALASRSDCDMERYLRDTRPLELAAGGPEVDRDVIARGFGL